ETDATGRLVYGDDGKPVRVPWPDLAAQIAEVTGQDAETVQQIVDGAVAENPQSRFAYIKRTVSTEEYRALAELGLPFLSFPQHPSRTYPDGAVAGNILGFVGSDGTPLEGIETLQNDCLTGDGRRQRAAEAVLPAGPEAARLSRGGGSRRRTRGPAPGWDEQLLVAAETQGMAADGAGTLIVDVATSNGGVPPEAASNHFHD